MDLISVKEERWKTYPVIALAGNPNVGKSTVFNALTGMHQHTGNWPGKTVTTAEGVCKYKNRKYRLVDLPGTYSLLARSPEEAAARDFIASGRADAVVVVCDATCLERNLNLALQIMEICRRVVVCVNLLDEAERKGIRVDISGLAEKVGVPVVGVVGHRKRTLSPLLATMASSLSEEPPNPIVSPGQHTLLPEERLAVCHQVFCETVHCSSDLGDRSDRTADRILTGRKFGYPLMAILLAFILWLTIKGANYPSRILAEALTGLETVLSRLLLSLGVAPLLHDALILGVYRMLSWVISVMLPPMAIFFPLFTFLEDIGYLPRIAFNLDKPFQRCGACGKQALTMAMGFGCNAAGVIGCRIIDSPRERLLAIATNSLVPCNGRFPILISLLSVFFAADSSILAAIMLTGLIMTGIGATFLVTGLLSKTVLKGTPSFFTLEMPPYRRPQPGKILVRSIMDRTLFVLGRAAAVAAPAGLLLWAMANTHVNDAPLLQIVSDGLSPVGAFLGLDGAILLAFLLGWPANETVVPILLMIYLSGNSLSDGFSLSQIHAILASNGWTPVTALCVLLFTMFHWPCSTTMLTIYKETKSIGWTLLSAFLPTAVGAAACIAVRITGALLLR